MYTVDCEDPNCVKCKQVPEGPSSGEENRCKIPETVEQSSQEESQKKLLETVKEVVTKDLHLAVIDRRNCLSICRRLKKEVHCEFKALINILRERELDLCIEIEREYDAQVQKIDENIAASCADKIMKRNDENNSFSAESVLTFNSDFDDLKRRLMCYGQLKYKDNELYKMWIEHKETLKKYSQVQAGTGDALSSASSSQLDFKTTSWAKNATLMSSARPVEVQVNHKEMKRELEKQKHMMESASEDIYIARDLNSIKNGTGRIGSANNDVPELSFNIKEDSDATLLYNAYRLKEIILHLNDRKCLAPAVGEMLERNCENIRDIDAFSACLRDLSHALYVPAKPSIGSCSHRGLIKKYKDLAVENLTLRNRIKLLKKIYKKNELTMAIKNLEEKNVKEMHEESMKSVLDLERDKITSQSSGNTDSSTNEEDDTDSSWDEDDIEIISSQETESIPSELPFSPPLPPKNRFKFGGKISCVPSFLRKKVDRKPPPFKRHEIKLEMPDNGANESEKNSLDSSSSNPEMKENQSFNEKHQKPSSECFDCPKDVGQDNDPTGALRSSFTKYLEKNPKNDWLAPVKSSEWSKSASENCCKERDVPNFVQEMGQWLPAEYNQKMASDWLHPAHM